MRALILVLLVACGGGKKTATLGFSRSPPPPETVSVLEQQERLEESASSEQASGRRLNSLSSDVAVRHRRQAIDWTDTIALADDTQHVGTSQAPPPAQPLASPEVQQPEKLVVEGWLDLETDNVGGTVDMIRARIEASGGRVVSENVQGSGKAAGSAAMELRVPPSQATAIATWLGSLGTVTNKRMLASDVSKKLFDQELALTNLELTMERLQKLASQSGPINDLLTIEKEMTRVRGEIEVLKGERRWLLDRVAFATLTVSITRRDNDESIYDLAPSARLYAGPHLAMLALLDPGMRQPTRAGAGVMVRLARYATFELDVFPRVDGGESRAVLATFGTALYSGYLGYGNRRYVNPYLGARVGYGYLSDNASPVVAAELGVELVKHKYLLVDSSLRAIAFVTNSAEVALHATLGLSVPF